MDYRRASYILLVAALIASLSSVSAINRFIELNGGGGKVGVGDINILDNASQASWNIWVRQAAYTGNATLFGKYVAQTGGRSFLLRTWGDDDLSIILSANGVSVGHYTTQDSRECGIRNNNEWTMLTFTYNGSQIRYYRNGVLCDSDQTSISRIYASTTGLDFGAGNGRYFNGSIDDIKIYRRAIPASLIKRFYDESDYGNNLGVSVPVLVYHRIDENASARETVTPTMFRAQMRYLDDAGFNPITLRTFDEWRNGKTALPSKPVVITFDDGHVSVYDVALPEMENRGFVGSVNVVTSYADSFAGYKRWDMLREKEANGWSIESHGVHHYNMLTLNQSAFRQELSVSRARIAEEINVTPVSFVFPFHSANTTYTAICGQYYRLCWTAANEAGNPVYVYRSTNGTAYASLKRITITNTTTMSDFKGIFVTGVQLVGQWRMNEGSGNVTGDESYNHNNGILNSGARWATG